MSLILEDLFNVSDFTGCDQLWLWRGYDVRVQISDLLPRRQTKVAGDCQGNYCCCLDLSDYKGDCLNLVKLSDCEGDCSHENLSHIYNTWLF